MDRERSSPRSIASQFLDWVLVIIVVAVSLSLINVNPDSHDFSIADLSLSYAHRENPKIPLWLLILLAVVAPAVTIVITSLRAHSSPVQWRLQGFNDALLGLGISLGSASVILNIKNLAGKPRPDFLAICQPDLQNIAAHKVGGYGKDINVMVYRTICQQSDHRWLNDAFRSFPSGYSTVAFASLCYTAVWLCRRFNLPLFTMRGGNEKRQHRYSFTAEGTQSLLHREEADPAEDATQTRQSMALPVYYLFIPYIPIGLAIFIAGTRYFDFRNHGIDVIAGAAGGVFSAYVGISWIGYEVH